MNKHEYLCQIVVGLDEKIKRQINGSREHFINASYMSSLPYCDYLLELHDNGFDNYPAIHIQNPNAIFFMEKIIGCKMRHIDGKNDFFHTFCVPLIKKAGEVDKISIDLSDLSDNAVWNAYYRELKAHAASPKSSLPVALPAFSPIDSACSIMGQQEFFTLLADDMLAALHIIDFLCDLYIAMLEQIKKSNVKTIGATGYAGTYISDLNAVNISPNMIEKIIPFYQKIADFAGGLTLSIAVPDISVMRDIVSIPSFYGFFFDSRLQLKDIAGILGKKLFIIYNYIFDENLDGVTLKDGVYVNPIVNSHSCDITETFQELAGDHSIMASIERYTLRETVDATKNLLIF